MEEVMEILGIAVSVITSSACWSAGHQGDRAGTTSGCRLIAGSLGACGHCGHADYALIPCKGLLTALALVFFGSGGYRRKSGLQAAYGD